MPALSGSTKPALKESRKEREKGMDWGNRAGQERWRSLQLLLDFAGVLQTLGEYNFGSSRHGCRHPFPLLRVLEMPTSSEARSQL